MTRADLPYIVIGLLVAQAVCVLWFLLLVGRAAQFECPMLEEEGEGDEEACNRS